jgi:hypothetical protein
MNGTDTNTDTDTDTNTEMGIIVRQALIGITDRNLLFGRRHVLNAARIRSVSVSVISRLRQSRTSALAFNVDSISFATFLACLSYLAAIASWGLLRMSKVASSSSLCGVYPHPPTH